MRADLSFNRSSWIYRLDYRKLIIIAILLRFIFASIYDIFVSVTDNDFLLPDSKFYSVRGRYMAAVLNGYSTETFNWGMVPQDGISRGLFLEIVTKHRGHLPPSLNENNLFSFMIGFIYFLFGYFPLGVRSFNILLSIASAYLLFKIAKRHFGTLTANLFLLIALFLPTQLGYSITMSKDLLRMFVVYLILWGIYG